MSATLCGVCNIQPSRYKCPACQLPYCSLVCYKPHKASHAADEKVPNDATLSNIKSELASTIPSPVTASIAVPTYPPKPQLPLDFSSLPTSPAITHLFSADATLKPKLLSIYKATLPGSLSNHDDDDHSEKRQRFNRGGRGRGSQRGRQERSRGPWTQEKADADAVKMIKEALAREGKESGIAEFVRLVGELGNESPLKKS